jgi:hypothetical protein
MYSADIGALNMAKTSLSLTSSETPASTKENIQPHWLRAVGRRSLLKGLGMAGATLSTGVLLVSKLQADEDHDHDRNERLTKGDAAILGVKIFRLT